MHVADNGPIYSHVYLDRSCTNYPKTSGQVDDMEVEKLMSRPTFLRGMWSAISTFLTVINTILEQGVANGIGTSHMHINRKAKNG